MRGNLEPEQLGTYPFSNRKPVPGQKGCIAHLFIMHVQEELETWPECANRARRWVRSLPNSASATRRRQRCRLLGSCISFR